MRADFFLDYLSRVPIMAILRGRSGGESAVQAAEACWAVGIELVEVSLSEEGALDCLRAVCRRAAERGRQAGAGTLLSSQAVGEAVAAGAAFGVTPGLDPVVLETARSAKLPLLPGVATPTEIQTALGQGYQVLKLFPAQLLGPEWIRAMQGPFPAARFVAVGGVSAGNARSFLAAGAVGLGMGSALDLDHLDDLVGTVGERG